MASNTVRRTTSLKKRFRINAASDLSYAEFTQAMTDFFKGRPELLSPEAVTEDTSHCISPASQLEMHDAVMNCLSFLEAAVPDHLKPLAGHIRSEMAFAALDVQAVRAMMDKLFELLPTRAASSSAPVVDSQSLVTAYISVSADESIDIIDTVQHFFIPMDAIRADKVPPPTVFRQRDQVLIRGLNVSALDSELVPQLWWQPVTDPFLLMLGEAFNAYNARPYPCVHQFGYSAAQSPSSDQDQSGDLPKPPSA